MYATIITTTTTTKRELRFVTTIKYKNAFYSLSFADKEDRKQTSITIPKNDNN